MTALRTFPDTIRADFKGGPRFNTGVVELDSGIEQRDALWAQARIDGTISVPARQEDDAQALLKFFRAVGAGRANKFRIRDWSDFRATASEGIFAVIDATHFQAYKSYSVGSSFHERKITRLRGTPTTTGSITGAAWDLDTGILTVASGTPTSWAGMFDVPVRFDTDHMEWEFVGQNPLGPIIEWTAVPIIEVRE